MTIDEAIELANNGDLDAMFALGSYYFEQNKLIEQREWFVKAAEGGLAKALVPAAICSSMYVHVKRKVSGGDDIYDADIDELNRDLRWVEMAKASGEDTDADVGIVRNRAICAFYASRKEGSAISRDVSLRYLKEAYSAPEKTPEVDIYLAIALSNADQLTAEDRQLCFNLLRHCVNYGDDDAPDINLGVIDASLGFCYLEGKGCSVDDNAAYECFVRAGQKGFDCSDILRNFKKKMFGGYVFKR